MKKILALLFAVATTLAAAAPVIPQRNMVEVTVHHGPGGPSDKIARYLSINSPSKDYIVVNRPGAAGRPATKHILSTNSVLVATVAQIYVANPITFKDLEYNPDSDLEVLAIVAQMPNMLVCRSTLGFKSFDEIINTQRSLNFAVSGYGSSEHIATEALFRRLKGTHQIIPYPNAGNKGMLDLLGGTIDCIFSNYPNVKPFVEDSKVTILFSSHALSPMVPTWKRYFKEPFPYQSNIALVVSKNMDSTVKQKIVSDMEKVFNNGTYQQDVLNIGLIPIGRTDAQSIAGMYKANVELRRFIEAAGIKTN
jgi:tripartite-type tricarboxylate transporter receptor subunit TctC